MAAISLAYCFLILSLLLSYACGSDPLTVIRGVSIQHQAFYNPLQDFTCLDGSRTIPFSSVNDDYCDCPDSSDEPGTAACPEGKYFCLNSGHSSKLIQSSRVNDGLCDCCDGSDEYDSNVVCFNECQKLAAVQLEKRKKEVEEANHGYNQKVQFIEEGKSAKEEKQKRFDHIKNLLEERRAILEELKSSKDAAESPEKEAIDKHKSEWEEKKNKLKEEREIIERGEAFQLLDTDKNGWIVLGEIMSNHYLDADISEDDAKVLLGEEMVDIEKFSDYWDLLKPKFLKDGRPAPKPDGEESTESQGENESGEGTDTPSGDQPPPPEEIPEPPTPAAEEGFDSHDIEMTPSDEDVDDEDDDEDDERDDDDDGVTTTSESQATNSDHEAMPEYDDETKKLIEVAEEARSKYNEEDQKVRELDREHKELEEYLGNDFGPHEEFATLKGQCFEYTDREYVYKLCPFDKVTQRSKDGGSETDLGKWGKWQEVGGDKYTRMKYENGQGCWNGPSRSALIRLTCGKENQLSSATEPSRCEYEMEFKTPASCVKIEHPDHTEL